MTLACFVITREFESDSISAKSEKWGASPKYVFCAKVEDASGADT